MYWRATHTLSLDSLNYSHSYVHHYLTSRLITPLKLLSSSCWWCPYWQILWPFIHLYIIIIFAIDNILPRTLYSLGFSDISSIQFSVRLFATPWTAACQAYLSITNSRSLLKLMSTESVRVLVMPNKVTCNGNHSWKHWSLRWHLQAADYSN